MAQVSVSALLLVIAALVARTLNNPEIIDPGFSGDGVFIGAIDLGHEYSQAQGVSFLDAVLERLEADPGVASVSLSGADGPLSVGSAKRDIAGILSNHRTYGQRPFGDVAGRSSVCGLPTLRWYTGQSSTAAYPVSANAHQGALSSDPWQLRCSAAACDQ